MSLRTTSGKGIEPSRVARAASVIISLFIDVWFQCARAAPSGKVSDWNQPPLMADSCLSEPAGSGSLHRLVGRLAGHATTQRVVAAGNRALSCDASNPR